MRAPNRTRLRVDRSRFTLAHGLMLVSGLMTFLLVTAALDDRGATTDVIVAAHDLPAGAQVGPSSFTVVSIDADDPLLVHLVTPTDAPAQLTRSVLAGQPILDTDLVALGPSSARTLTIPVVDPAVDGLGLRVGDRIDVIGHLGEDDLGFIVSDAPIARLPVAGARSLGSGTARSWVTIEVTERQALDLVGAIANGGVSIVRSTGAPPLGTTS